MKKRGKLCWQAFSVVAPWACLQATKSVLPKVFFYHLGIAVVVGRSLLYLQQKNMSSSPSLPTFLLGCNRSALTGSVTWHSAVLMEVSSCNRKTKHSGKQHTELRDLQTYLLIPFFSFPRWLQLNVQLCENVRPVITVMFGKLWKPSHGIVVRFNKISKEMFLTATKEERPGHKFYTL